MKKLFALLFVLAILFSLSACGTDKDGGAEEAESGQVGGPLAGGPMAYTLSKCTYTYPSGQETVVYTAELSDTAFTMNALTERIKGEVDRNSYVFEYNSKGISALREESQRYGQEVKVGRTTTLTYDADTATLTEANVRDGKTTSKDVYNLVWDGEGRLSSYKLTSYYYEYDDAGAVSFEETWEYNYSYAYGADSFTITKDVKDEEDIDDNRVELIQRTVSTVPYEEKGDIITEVRYYQTDGTTPVAVDDRNKKKEKQVMVSNWWGYETSNISYYTDGSTENEGRSGVTFDDQGRVVKTVSETYASDGMVKPGTDRELITVTTDFIYDENGNLTEVKRMFGSEQESYKFEWMEIPAKLDSQLALYSGAPHWSVTEFIDNFVDFSGEGKLTARIYKLDDFLSNLQ